MDADEATFERQRHLQGVVVRCEKAARLVEIVQADFAAIRVEDFLDFQDVVLKGIVLGVDDVFVAFTAQTILDGKIAVQLVQGYVVVELDHELFGAEEEPLVQLVKRNVYVGQNLPLIFFADFFPSKSSHFQGAKLTVRQLFENFGKGHEGLNFQFWGSALTLVVEPLKVECSIAEKISLDYVSVK